MRGLAFAAFAAMASGGAHADNGLELVRGALAGLHGGAPLRASIERGVDFRRKGRPDEIGSVTVRVKADPAGVALSYPAAFLAQLEAETRETDPEKPRPAHTLAETFGLQQVEGMIDVAARLESDLEGASLLGEEAGDRDGKPARRLQLRPTPRVSKADSKWVKNDAAEWILWAGADGLPLALEQTRTFQVGFLMFTFDVTESTVDEFRRVGDRLTLASRTNRVDGRGMGEEQHLRTETRIQIEDFKRP